MVDNTTLNTMTGGDVIATDDVVGVKYQRVKLVDGTLDSTTAIVSGGGVEAAALRVTVASDSTGVLSVDDNGGSLTVDGTVAVTNAALTSIDGKVPALGQALAAASVPVILPTATVTTLTPPAAITGFATSAKQDTLDTSVNTLLKPASTLAAVTTVGTITNAVAVTHAGLTALNGAVAGTEVQVDVITMPAVTVTSGSITADTELTTGDMDTGVGTDTRAVVGLVGSKSGGGEIIPGDATDGLLVNLGANNDVIITSGTVTANAGTGTLAVSLASVPSHAVTNVGTFAVQAAATLAAETTKVIGTSLTATG